MRICLELTSSGSQLAFHGRCAPVDGLLRGNEAELSSPGRGAVAIAPRRAARADDNKRQASVASPVARFPSTRPARDTPTSSTRPSLLKIRASTTDTLADLNTRALLHQARQQDEVTDPRARARHLEDPSQLQRAVT